MIFSNKYVTEVLQRGMLTISFKAISERIDMNKYDSILKNDNKNIITSEKEVLRNKFLKLLAEANEDVILKAIEYINKKF